MSSYTVEQIFSHISNLVLNGKVDEAEQYFLQLNRANPVVLQHSLTPISNWLLARNQFDINYDLMRSAALLNKDKARRVFISAMPKSGSTLLNKVLQAKDGGRRFRYNNLTSGLNVKWTPDNNGQVHELDESALLKACIKDYDWLSQRHQISSKFSDDMFNFYGVKPIITVRNIFDCLISAQDMYKSWYEQGINLHQMPNSLFNFNEKEQLDFFIFKHAYWYLQFYHSWSTSSIPNLMFNYNEWISDDPDNTATKIANFLSFDQAETENFIVTTRQVVDSKSQGAQGTRFNKGISDRGKIFTEEQQKYVRNMAQFIDNQFDWSPVLDFES